MEYVYHITTRSLWEAQQNKRVYLPPTYGLDGFIHLSTLSQVRETAYKFFRGQKDLVVLEIDPSFYPDKLIFEAPGGGSELFPHLYAPLEVDTVHQLYELPLKVSSEFNFPAIFLFA
jgi:uncharacterized protein (DUF952 family)